MPMRPFVVSGNPPPLISVHVSPASVDFQSADPGSAGLQEVRTAHALPARRPDDVRVRRVERDVDEARLVARRTSRAATSGRRPRSCRARAPDSRSTARRARRRRRCSGFVGCTTMRPIGCVFSRPIELPRDAAVGRLVDAAARRDRVARVRLARAGPHLHRVARRDREHAHRDDALVVEHRAPRRRRCSSTSRCRPRPRRRRTFSTATEFPTTSDTRPIVFAGPTLRQRKPAIVSESSSKGLDAVAGVCAAGRRGKCERDDED